MRLPPLLLPLWLGACSSGSVVVGRLDAPTPDGGAPPFSDAGTCAAPRPSHEWSFADGTLTDRQGSGAAVLRGGAILEGGLVRLDGKGGYVDLPNGLLAGLDEVTLALWVRARGGPAYTRLIDIGTGSLGEDPPPESSYVGRSYLVLTPFTGFVPDRLAALASNAGPPAEVVAPSLGTGDEDLHLIAVTFSTATLSLFRDGVLLARVPRSFPLSDVVDHNAWLGRSQYAADPYLEGAYASVRVFGTALAECAVAELFVAGPP